MIILQDNENSQSGQPEMGIWEMLENPSPILITVGIVFGLLIVATCIVLLWPKPKRNKVFLEVRARLKSWWVMVILFVLALTIDWRLSICFIALLSFFALKEFFTLVHLRIADRRAILLAYVAIPIQFWWVYTGWYGMFIIFIPVYMFLIIAFRLVVAGESERYMTSAGKLHWGLMAFVFGISHLAFFLVLQPIDSFEAGGRGLMFYVIFLAEFNDVLQYLFGRTFGKHKMAPKISPNKTWEGFFGGLICTSFLAVGMNFLTPMLWYHALGAGLLIGILGPVGDLVMSAIKRDVGVKDTGSLIPGHGGILDRIDSLCFTVPLFFHYVTYLYYPAISFYQ